MSPNSQPNNKMPYANVPACPLPAKSPNIHPDKYMSYGNVLACPPTPTPVPVGILPTPYGAPSPPAAMISKSLGGQAKLDTATVPPRGPLTNLPSAALETAGNARTQDAPQRLFHRNFDVKKPGDLILCAELDVRDQILRQSPMKNHFYFPRHLLEAYSSWFAQLSPTPAGKLIDGATIVSMPNVTPSSLALFLHVLRSTTEVNPYRVSHHADTDILGAAVIGKEYSVPIVHRLLCDPLDTSQDTEGTTFLRFAIWAIGGSQDMMRETAKSTLCLGLDITAVNRDIVDIVKRHAPACWLKLLDLHIRYDKGPARFHKIIRKLPSTFSFESRHRYIPPSEGETGKGTYEKCEEAAKSDPAAKVTQRFMEAQSLEDIWAVAKDGYGLKCSGCQAGAENHFGRRVTWLRKFTSDFELPAAAYQEPYGWY